MTTGETYSVTPQDTSGAKTGEENKSGGICERARQYRSGGGNTPGLNTSSRFLTGEKAPEQAPEKARETGRNDVPSQTARRRPNSLPIFYCLLDNCLEKIDQALEDVSDIIGKSNALSAFASYVEQIWEERNNYERDWVLLVNQLRCILLDVDFKDVSEKQIVALESVCNTLYNSKSITEDSLDSCLTTLEEGGWKLFRELE